LFRLIEFIAHIRESFEERFCEASGEKLLLR
jgi:hypothetical protein